MIEIALSDMAGVRLILAQSYGVGEYKETFDFTILESEKRKAPPKEIEAYTKQFNDRERKKWESATPLSGSEDDVFGFNLMLDIGDIGDENFFTKRKKIIREFFSPFPDYEGAKVSKGIVEHEKTDVADEIVARAEANLVEIENRIKDGEPIRIWYSSNPQELCGFFWFMSWLSGLYVEPFEIFIVRLPEIDFDQDVKIEKNSGWDEADLYLFTRCLELQQAVSFEFCQSCSLIWHEHQEQNAGLRVEINGKLVTVSMDFYDDLIRRECLKMKGKFEEMLIIGSISNSYHPGINPVFLSRRIDLMISKGYLKSVKKNRTGCPYSRILKNYKWNNMNK